MKKNTVNKENTIANLLFIDRFPKLDLHGYDRECARVAIQDFILENKKLKNEYVVIVHGIGSGILRNTTQEVLRRNKDVVSARIDYYNGGCTVVHIVIDK